VKSSAGAHFNTFVSALILLAILLRILTSNGDVAGSSSRRSASSEETDSEATLVAPLVEDLDPSLASPSLGILRGILSSSNPSALSGFDPEFTEGSKDGARP
jgi:hypothetical protein